MNPAITAIYGGLLGLLFLVLCWQVVDRRRKGRVGLGTGGNPDLERAIRVHGNFAEYGVLALLLMALAESAEAAPLWLHASGVLLIAGRLVHPFGVGEDGGVFAARVAGMSATYAAILVPAVAAVLSTAFA